MNNKRLVALTIGWILAAVPGQCVWSFAGTESGTNSEAEQHFEKANELRKAADYDAAITEYKKVMSLSPKGKIAQDAQYWIGQSHFEARQFDAALSAFQKLLDEHPASSIIPSTKQMIERVQQAKKNKSLFEAVKKADIEQVKLLIDEGADVDAKWVDVYNENENENKSSRDKKWHNESTPLFHAVNVGKIEVVMLLVEAGADVNAEGWTPLCRAVDENNTAIAEYLIDHGANVNMYPVEVEGWGPLQETVYISNSVEMAKLLIARGADINSRIYPVLNSATHEKRRDLCELLIQRGADVNAKDKWGRASLYYAIRNDDSDIMNILIANGAEVDIKHTGGETGETALHYAVRLGKKNVVELLIARGADINAKDKQGHTPLYIAVNHDYKVAELLMNKGADSDIRTESGQTLLQLAQQRKQAESTVPDMIFEGDPNSFFGLHTVCGDVDGDGYDDILIVEGSGNNYGNNRSRVYLFYGGPDMDTTADLIFEGQNEAGDWFGSGIRCGDIDNDGYEDIVIAAGCYSEKRGRAYLYWGSDRHSMDANPDKIFVGEQEKGSEFGSGWPAVYDIDNDGYDDIILGAVRSGDSTGRAYLYYGNTKELMDTSHDHIFTPENSSNQHFGYTIDCGDVDNDGYGDIVIGNFSGRKGRTYLYYGDSKSKMDAKTDLIFEVSSEGANAFGQGIVCIDQNRDGYDDVVIGARGYNNKQGRAYLFHGNSKRSLDANPDIILDGEVEHSNYGARMICGDIDGDHVNDLVIGANGSGQRIGRVYVYWGKDLAGPDPKPGRIFTGEHPNAGFGFGLACGDVNNDGFDDLVIGAYASKAGAKPGRAYLYYGGPLKK